MKKVLFVGKTATKVYIDDWLTFAYFSSRTIKYSPDRGPVMDTAKKWTKIGVSRTVLDNGSMQIALKAAVRQWRLTPRELRKGDE
ncbi:MAG TPA: hypothetical protein VGK56_01275 [Anaerolineales bacterium]